MSSHNQDPFFSVVIFTKNRSEHAGWALASVLKQTFTDFEVIVSDNDDTDATSKVINRYHDPRLHYHCTNGTLSMLDNWEVAVAMARGQYILSLTDRCAVKSYALANIKGAIDREGEDVYIWPPYYLMESDTYDLMIAPAQFEADGVIPSRQLFEWFLTKNFEGYTHLLPKGINSCCSKSLLEDIRRSTGGRVCLPISPDHNLAFLTLAHRPRVVLLNHSLFVWGAHHLSNGGGVYRPSDTSRRFLKDLGITERKLYNAVPIKAIGIHNSICNDFMNLKRTFPEKFGQVNLQLVPYFLICHQEIEQYLSPDDPLYDQRMTAWADALSQQPPELATEVRQRVNTSCTNKWRRGYRSIRRTAGRVYRGLYPTPEPACPTAATPDADRPAKFSNILEAVSWLEKHDSHQVLTETLRVTHRPN